MYKILLAAAFILVSPHPRAESADAPKAMTAEDRARLAEFAFGGGTAFPTDPHTAVVTGKAGALTPAARTALAEGLRTHPGFRGANDPEVEALAAGRLPGDRSVTVMIQIDGGSERIIGAAIAGRPSSAPAPARTDDTLEATAVRHASVANLLLDPKARVQVAQEGNAVRLQLRPSLLTRDARNDVTAAASALAATHPEVSADIGQALIRDNFITLRYRVDASAARLTGMGTGWILVDIFEEAPRVPAREPLSPAAADAPVGGEYRGVPAPNLRLPGGLPRAMVGVQRKLGDLPSVPPSDFRAFSTYETAVQQINTAMTRVLKDASTFVVAKKLPGSASDMIVRATKQLSEARAELIELGRPVDQRRPRSTGLNPRLPLLRAYESINNLTR